MRKVIFAMLLTGVSSSAMAEWIEVEHSSDGIVTIYANPSSIRTVGDMAEMWDLGDFKTAQDSGVDTKFKSIMVLSEYSCKGGQYRTMFSSYFSGNMGGGEIIGTYPESGKWMPILPDTLHESLFKFACGKK